MGKKGSPRVTSSESPDSPGGSAKLGANTEANTGIERPAELVYAIDEIPPFRRCLLVAAQHIAVICPTLVLIAIVAGAAGATAEESRVGMARGLLAIAIMTALQAIRTKAVGSGFLLPPVITATYLPASLAAVSTGGFALMAGMTVLGGFAQALFSRILGIFRKVFPAVVSGVILIAVAMELCRIGMGVVFDPDLVHEHRFHRVGGVTLATLIPIVALGVWGRGLPKLLCSLFGIVIGYLAAAAIGIFTLTDLEKITALPLFALPSFHGISFSFSLDVLLLFLVAALANSLRCVGVLTTCQQINDAAWKRPDMRRTQAGVMADGLGVAACGLLGTTAGAASPSLVGVQKATGVTSRVIAWYIVALSLLLACLPSLTMLLVQMPRPVMGAALFFNGAMMFVAGVQVISSRPITLRSTMVLGFSVMLGVGTMVFPEFFHALPGVLHQLTNSPISISVLTAVGLNLVFLLGRWNFSRDLQMQWEGNNDSTAEGFLKFFQAESKKWKVPASEIHRAKSVLEEVLSLVQGNIQDGSRIEGRVGSDDFDIRIDLRYEGSLPALPHNKRPSGDLVEEQSFAAGLSGYLSNIRADSINSSSHGTHCEITLLFKT